MKKNFIKNNIGLVFWFFVVLYYSLILFLSSLQFPPKPELLLGLSISSYIKHFVLYSVFGILMNFAFFHSLKGSLKKYSYVFAVLLGFLLACFDEFFQGFTPGRTTDIFDALADTLGVLFVQVVIFFLRLKNKK